MTICSDNHMNYRLNNATVPELSFDVDQPFWGSSFFEASQVKTEQKKEWKER